MKKTKIIKYSKQMLGQIYDEIIRSIDNYFDKDSMNYSCRINLKGLCPSCARAFVKIAENRFYLSSCKNNKQIVEKIKSLSFCCGGCEHLKPEGCSVDSIGCRMWFCEEVIRINPHIKSLQERMDYLVKFADTYCLRGFRMSREQNINNAYRILNRLTSEKYRTRLTLEEYEQRKKLKNRGKNVRN